MAKQRLNILEMHLEKAVLGVAVVLLGVVAFRYLIQTPNVIEEGGRKYRPGSYDKSVVRGKAERLKATFTRKPDPPAPVPDYLGEFKRVQEKPLASVGAEEVWPAIQPWRPEVPPALGTKPIEPGQILLARVLPPDRPLAYAGLTTILVEPPRPLDAPALTGSQQREVEALIREKDRSWVTVSATVNLEAQRKEFSRAHYDFDLQDITICRIRAQRQRRLPSGGWSEWQEIQPWAPYTPVRIPKVELIAGGSGFILPDKEREVAAQFLNLVWDFAPEIKAPLPPYAVAGDVWRLPTLPKVNWCALDLDWLQEEPNADGCNPYFAELPEPAVAAGPESEGGRARPGDLKRKGRRQATADLNRAEELYSAGALADLYEAERLVKEVRANKYAAKRVKDKADKLYAKILIALDEKEAEQAGDTAQEEPEDQPQVPPREELPEQTVVWVHDLPVEPGFTYRYRLAVDLYNYYLGKYDKLLDTDAASSLVVQGEWSDPSNPVEVKPELAFFVTSVGEKEAKIDIYRWFRGRVAYRKVRIAPGERITLADFVKIPGQRGKFAVDFDTGYRLLAMEAARPALMRETVGRKGAIRFREATTPVVLCVDDRGRLMERSKIGNQDEQRQWSALAKKYKAE